MKNIASSRITETVKELVIKANKVLPSDLIDCISCSEKRECSETAKSVLSDLKANIDAAAELNIPICQGYRHGRYICGNRSRCAYYG